MNQKTIYDLFEQMIATATKELFEFTLHSSIQIVQKQDKSFVTDCDKQIDERLSKLAQEAGLQVVSEEGEHSLDIVKTGNYLTIDPIDGTLGYIENVKYALEHGGIRTFLQKDLGIQSSFCLLLGVVGNSTPRYCACYNYVTKEKILIDGGNRDNFIWENPYPSPTQDNVVYLDPRQGNSLERLLVNLSDVTITRLASLGLRTIYTIINPHKNAITLHTVQAAGLWDILPAAVAARAFDGSIYGTNGNILKLNKYVILPGTGVVAVKGTKFEFIVDRLKQYRG